MRADISAFIRRKNFRKMLDRQGIKCWKINYKHALHAPYWWLKCLVGLKNESNVFVRYYRKFLEWDIMSKPQCGADSGRILESADW